MLPESFLLYREMKALTQRLAVLKNGTEKIEPAVLLEMQEHLKSLRKRFRELRLNNRKEAMQIKETKELLQTEEVLDQLEAELEAL